MYIPGQHWVLQAMMVTFSPLQSLPPQLGLGWVQWRNWVNVPPPQETEQSVWLCQGLHPPSTNNKIINYYTYIVGLQSIYEHMHT